MPDPNLPLLKDAAGKLAPFLDEGRESVIHEIEQSDEAVRDYLTQAAQALLANSQFLDVRPGFVLDQERVPLIEKRLASIAAIVR